MPNKTIIAIGAITAIVITCIFKDIDSLIIVSGTALIAGLGGYIAGKVKKS